ncbi:MAG: competence protein ComK [Bacilli bacterium]|uniref:competence protein ComK n=1 Tax=Anaerorhabdus sp. TaxID=1872524 RepID=UPI002FCAC38B
MPMHSDIIYFDQKTYETVCIKNQDNEIRFKGKPTKVLNEWCLEHGSSLEGRIDSFKYLLKVRQKPGILISERCKVLFIPTLSTTSNDCRYIQYTHIKKIIKNGPKSCTVTMNNGNSYNFNVDYRVIKQQQKRAKLYLSKLRLLDGKFIFLR